MISVQRMTVIAVLLGAAAAGVLQGCRTREPITILFTGDEQGRLVPEG